MRYRLYSTLATAALLMTAACQATDNGGPATAPATLAAEPAASEPPPPSLEVATSSPIPSATPASAPPTLTPAVTPPPPVVVLPEGWRFGGSRQQGVQIGLPPDWVDLSSLRDEPEVSRRFSDNLRYFAADRKETGLQALSETPLAGGALVLAFARQSSSSDPALELASLLTAQGVATDTLATVIVNSQTVAYIDLDSDPLGLLNISPEGFAERLLLTPLSAGEQMLFLFAAPGGGANDPQVLFDALLQTVQVFAPADSALASGAAYSSALPLTGNIRRTDVLRAGQANVYSFTARAGQFLTAIAAPQDGSDLTLDLVGPAGRLLTGSDRGFGGDSELITDFSLPLTGTYFLRVGEFFGQSGDFSLSLQVTDSPLFGGGGAIAFGQEVAGTLRANESHTWVFNGIAGQVLSVVLTPGSEPLDVVLRLFGPDGERQLNLDEGFSGDAEIIAGYELTISGEYTIEVKDFSGRGGPYRLALDEGDSGLANFYEAGDLLSGAVVQETLQPREAHTWFIDGFAGDQISIIAAPLADNVDLKIWLLTPQLERLVITDDTLSGEIETIALTLPENGQYVLLVEEFYGSGGGYQISYVVIGNDLLEVGGTLLNGETVSDRLRAGKAALWFFDAVADDVVTISVTPATAQTDLVLVLRSPNGSPVITIDDAGPGGAELLDAYMLSSDGAWSVLVREFLDGGGGYTLTVTIEME